MARRSARADERSADSQSSTSDAEGDESQRLSALTSLLQKPKTNHKELRDFKAKVTAGQKEFKLLLEQRTQQAKQDSMYRCNEFTKALLDALCTPDQAAPGKRPTLGNTKIDGNPASNSIAKITRYSEALIGEYHRLDGVIMDVQDAQPKNIAKGWADDIEMTASLLKIGAKTAIKNVKKVLGVDVSDDGVEGAGEEGEKMGAVKDTELDYGLHESLRLAERGVRNMVKNLLRDEEL
ncbi:hypothetical protein B5807_03499 [Epicoccum nigrum]|uniref:Uncharacterized protein n=1 Tax=Epicoccum nigrum TaxID=105696 RepID=A0A1Y2M571_EPING|nr:hypothetical protein B5807_03499 [Epicoccum nigrum]